MIQIYSDAYDGIIVDNSTLPIDIVEFENQINQLFVLYAHKKLLWIQVPIEKSLYIPILTKNGFEFHNCDEKNLMLVKKIHENSFIPITKNYIVGVGAVVLNEGKLLVIQDKFTKGYKFPGGHIEKNESIKEAVAREVFEETGIRVEFESIINIGHFRNGQFGESNLYIVCTAKALSKEICVHDSLEIIEAKWILPQEFVDSEHVNQYNKSIINLIIQNKEKNLIEQHIPLRVTKGEVFF